jgi:hypothetical protein
MRGAFFLPKGETKMNRNLHDLSAIPHAGGYSLMACDDRGHVHVVLFDERDREPLMQFTLTKAQLGDFVARSDDIFAGTSFGH